ncbi:MAG: hypothetical protein COW71_00690 [Ignavibacteriales bacterium CG18_big_fil_WC_8_21_14_2_50_31_20]|nr:MAG: hypothetical protein COW71_00690 [Ignavibacteriales bacterium CG18_big_fil_WC_8_21_14_2_50_31_20]
MEQQKAFEIIKEVFTKAVNSFHNDKITNEADWESHLYCMFRDALGEKVFEKYDLILEGRAAKYDGKNILWITPNKYSKSHVLIDEYFDVIIDKVGHIKLELDKNKKPLNKEIHNLIEAEKNRAYYVDIMLLDKTNKKQSRVFLIELKMKEGLDEGIVDEDFLKLKRTAEVRNPESIYIAIGFDPLNRKVIWKATNEKFNYSINLIENLEVSEKGNSNQPFSEEKVTQILKSTTEQIMQDYVWAKEIQWASEVMYQFQKVMPTNWSCHSEVSGIFDATRGRLDLGLYNNDKLEYAIELKAHYEGAIPPELNNGMTSDKNIKNDFIKQSKEFFAKFEADKKIKSQLSKYPKLNGRDFITSDFFDKIIEMYDQCKRLSKLEKEGKISKTYMVFTDHQDDFSMRRNKPNISEDAFKGNFRFRKQLIKELLAPIMGNCELIYFYALNYKKDRKEMFLLDD